MNFRSLSVFAATVFLCVAAFAHDYKAGDLSIVHPYARATVPNQPSGAAYLTIENQGKQNDKLIAASSPIAKSTQIHTMSMDGNVMRMREVGSLDIKPGEKMTMTPGHGYHIMLIGLSQPLKTGDKFPLTLTFEKAGKVEVSVWVEDKGAGAPADSMHHHHH